MKKTLALLTLVTIVGASSTSCIKSCNCTDYDSNGNIIAEYHEPIVRGTGMNCKDYDYSDINGKTVCKK